MTKPDNTTARMKDPAEKLLWLGEVMVHGNDAPILAQERDGQRQLAASEYLPTDIKGNRAEFEALGFTFGDLDPDDPMFMPATLPDGWKKQPTEHSMWTTVVDQHGRERVAVFYKAAFYDRSAFMRLESIEEYVRKHVEYDGPLVITDEWATPETVATALAHCRDEALADGARFQGYSQEAHRDEGNRAELREIADKYNAAAAKYAAKLDSLIPAGGKLRVRA